MLSSLVGEKIKISGFGNFEVKEKDERTGRNPQTGQEIKIAITNQISQPVDTAKDLNKVRELFKSKEK